ncbi:MAG: class I SAM-dependent methyltransferase [Chloroflexi bacterium]|nr:class I SAM-dependent methyltransferase [Chloroflexota bacterium]
MARLESVARAGYYPTPSRVAAAVAQHLSRSVGGARRVVRLLDPCAGTGEAAAWVADSLGAESFGIELNEVRAVAARDRLDHVLHTSAFSVRLTNGAFSCLYLNAPYDHDDEARRLEHAFLTSLTRALCVGGLLIYVVQQSRLVVSSRYLSSHYTGFQAFRFPDPEYGAFRQMVLFASRKPKGINDAFARAQLDEWSRGDLAPLPEAPAAPTVVVPSLPVDDVLFASLTVDPEQAASEARRRGAWIQPELAEQLWPPDERPVRPLMPLRRGHLALLIAAGMLNNCALDRRDRRVLVKGRTYKESVRIDSDDDDVEIQREVIRTSIAVLDLATGDFEIVEQDDRVPAERAA